MSQKTQLYIGNRKRVFKERHVSTHSQTHNNSKNTHYIFTKYTAMHQLHQKITMVAIVGVLFRPS